MAKQPKIDSLEFVPAKGGLVSKLHTKTERGGKGGGPMYDHDTVETIHPTMAHAKKHLVTHLAHVYGEASEGKLKEEGPGAEQTMPGDEE